MLRLSLHVPGLACMISVSNYCLSVYSLMSMPSDSDETNDDNSEYLLNYSVIQKVTCLLEKSMEVHVGEEALEDSNFDNELVLLASKKCWVIDSIEDTGFVFQSKVLQGMPLHLIDQWKFCDEVSAIDEEIKIALGIQYYTVYSDLV